MRVCLLTLDFPPFRSSGLTIYAEQVAKGLAARGHTVTVVASDRGIRDHGDMIRLPDTITVTRLPIRRLDWISFGWQAARYLHLWKDNFDIVHFADVHFAYAYRGPFIASAFQSFRQRLKSHHGHPYHSSWRNYLFRLVYYTGARWIMERPAVQRASHIIMPSLSTQREFIEHYHVDPARTTLVYPGIDVHRFDNLPSRAEARRELGLPANVPILLYVGFSTPRKGVEYLAQALRKMKIPAYLVMVGKWESGYQRRFLDTLGEARSQVHIAGYVADADLKVYFAAADTFVLPTLLEGFGFPLVEAMAAGIPVVTTTGGSAAEVVGDAGVVVPPANSSALAAALDQVLATPDLARRLSDAGRNRVRLLFDENRFAENLIAVYRDILDAF